MPEPERAAVWAETVERTGGKPTAAAVRDTYEQRQQRPAPDEPPSDKDLFAGEDWVQPAGPGFQDAVTPPRSARAPRLGGRWRQPSPCG